MNYAILYRCRGDCCTVLVRSITRAQELVDLAKHGDTLHVVSEHLVGDYKVLLQEVREQLRQGRYKEIM